MESLDSSQPVSPTPPARPRFLNVGLTVVAVILIGFVAWPVLKQLAYTNGLVPAPEDHIAWTTDFDAALAKSKQTGKPVLLDFQADWCGPCQMMKHDVWPDKQIGDTVNSRFIPVSLNVDKPEAAEAARRYDVNGIPDIVIVDAQGNVLRQSVGALSIPQMQTFLDTK